jgi:signal transduction histidine kinase
MSSGAAPPATHRSSVPPEPAELRWIAAGVFVVLVGFASIAPLVGRFPNGHGARLLLTLPACALILLLRRWSLPVLAISAVGTAVLVATGVAALQISAMLGVAAYVAGSGSRRSYSIPTVLASALLLGGGLLYCALEVRYPPLGLEVVEGFLPLVAGWFIGDAVAARRRYLDGLVEQTARERLAEVERARLGVREERVRIARELHDVVAHTLAVITVQAGVGRRLMERQPEAAQHALESIESVGRTAQDELRVVLQLLRDEDVEKPDLAPAPKLADLQGLVETVHQSGIPVELTMPDSCGELSPALQLSIYRVVQEALTNVVKHAPGSRVRVAVEVSNSGVQVEVTNGVGRAGPFTSPAGAGHGIVGMRERIGAFGGTLEAAPAGDSGYRVLARVPIEGAG